MLFETTVSETAKQTSLFLEKKNANLKITERDLSIIEFLLEMKFAGYEELYQKFFPPAETCTGVIRIGRGSVLLDSGAMGS